jgi:hypothetical protein
MPVLNPISAGWNTVARFEDYESAQRAVDRLSDDAFAVDKPRPAGASASRSTEGLGAQGPPRLSAATGEEPGQAARFRFPVSRVVAPAPGDRRNGPFENLLGLTDFAGGHSPSRSSCRCSPISGASVGRPWPRHQS